MKTTKLLPYGLTDFASLMKDGYYYIDKSSYIPIIEDVARYFFFVRPRRFGKSLFINMLSQYYDKAKANDFDSTFGELYIGKHPTKFCSKYVVLNLDFSGIDGRSLEDMERSFHAYIKASIEDLVLKYNDIFTSEEISEVKKLDKSIDKFTNLCLLLKRKGEKLYLFMDEYDHFANILISANRDTDYKNLTHGNGFFRVFLNVIKKFTKETIERVFMTGVSPVAQDDLTSGFNIVANKSNDMRFNSMIGFSETEVKDMFTYYKEQGVFKGDVDQVIEDIRPWYNNYCFAKASINEPRLFNSDMVLYFLDNYLGEGEYPENMLDPNVKTDYDKLRRLIYMDKALTKESDTSRHNVSVIQEIVNNGGVACKIKCNFSLHEMVVPNNFKSMLYYLGLLSITDIYRDDTYLSIPNNVVREQLFSYLAETYKETYELSLNTMVLEDLMRDLAYDGQWREYFAYIAEQLRAQSSIREFLDGEAHVKAFLLAYMGMNNQYITLPEYEMNKGFTDFYMQPNLKSYPNMTHSYVIEIKYIKRGETDDVPKVIASAKEQLNKYIAEPKIQTTLGTTQLHAIVVVFKGWDLIAYEEI